MRSRHLLILTFILGFFAFSMLQEAKAWGKFGHLTVCDLAYRNFTPTTRKAVKALFGPGKEGILVEGRGKLPDRRYTSFNVGCLEEDELPRRNEDDHYINVARDVQAITGPNCTPGASCILAGIDRDLAILRDTSRPNEERVFSLMALGHWVGDIHQPLHVSYADDKGGNYILVSLAPRCAVGVDKPNNLHSLWDNCLLQAGLFERVRKRADFKKNWSRFTITYRAVDTLLANTTLTEEKAIVAGAPFEWAEQSYAIARTPATLYCIQVGGACRYDAERLVLKSKKEARTQQIAEAYLIQHAPVAEERVRLAGFRLAHLINSALDPAYSGPVQNGDQRP